METPHITQTVTTVCSIKGDTKPIKEISNGYLKDLLKKYRVAFKDELVVVKLALLAESRRRNLILENYE